jgi:8-oxo-dGTP pyrophosphatase MutT (NUDIX family)
MSLNKNATFLIGEGAAQLALLHTDTECTWEGRKYYPPSDPDVIRLIGRRRDGIISTCIVRITSARGVIIGRDISSGPYGVVCATNKKGGSRYTLGGGRLDSTQEEGAKLQSPVECMVRELKDELNIQLTPPQLRLFALRLIYDQDPITRTKTPKRNPDRSFSADAGFLGLVRETLTYAGNRGQSGETGPRKVMTLN